MTIIRRLSHFLVFAKPDAVRRNCIGEIITRLECKGFVLKDIKFVNPTIRQAKDHYAEHKGKDFFSELVQFTTSGPIVPMIWEGNIAAARSTIGASRPWEAMPGTIRGDLASSTPNNLVHCSDSIESAKREIGIWFEEFRD